ncbi:hypothetical protein LC55x_3236 [Lysobacter capsici]|nr:hypothetical protein LC55x_3236 [Lysobacter capsici]
MQGSRELRPNMTVSAVRARTCRSGYGIQTRFIDASSVGVMSRLGACGRRGQCDRHRADGERLQNTLERRRGWMGLRAGNAVCGDCRVEAGPGRHAPTSSESGAQAQSRRRDLHAIANRRDQLDQNGRRHGSQMGRARCDSGGRRLGDSRV